MLKDLQQALGISYLFISHDLSVIRHVCDRVVVMYVGKVAEVAEGLDLYINPQHPYTEALMSSVPISNPRQRNRSERIRLAGEVADPSNPPSGCYFHPRCQYAQDRCKQEEPLLRLTDEGHYAACHYSDELDLRGAIIE